MTSEKIDVLVKALIKAKSKFQPIVKDKVNTFFKAKYATLDSVIAAVDTALRENGLDVIQTTGFEGDKFGLITLLVHESGQFISGFYHLNPAKANDPQALGSALTYSRRYALAAMLGVTPEEDDDGAAASAKHESNGHQEAEHDTKLTFVPAAISEKSGEKNGKTWTQWGIKSPQGEWFSTFDEDLAEIATKAKAEGQPVELEFAVNGKYRNVVSLVLT